jgi:tetratricopeptide (TPR) repeat protein
MKLKIFIGGLLLVVLNSCSKDFLTITPQTSVVAASFFLTEEDYRQAVTGTYRPLHGLFNDAYVMGEMRSDNTHYVFKSNDRGGQNVQRENISGFTDISTNGYTRSKYVNCYSGIAKANAVLVRIDAAPLADAVKKNLKGQAEFLRAFYYFELVQYFGDVPLHLTEVTEASQTSLARSPKADVYKQIIADATDAAALLPITQNPKGQATKGAAKTLLAYVYMTLKQYPEAEAALKEVVNMGYSLLPDYAAVFDPSNKNHAESIFEVQYLQGTFGLSSNFAYQFAPAVTDTKNITGITGNNQGFGGWNIPSNDLIASYEAGDKRKAISIADGYNDANGVFVAQPYVKKYTHPHTTFNNTNNNWPVYRFADVLLLLAECLTEQNKPADALPFLNAVRKRAGLGDITTTNQVALRDIIAKERRVELAFENKRWLDLVRTGKAIEVMTSYGSKMKQQYPYLGAETYNVTANRFIFPVPFDELAINKLLTQNPGYQ